MLEYMPWSKKVTEECLNNYKNGKFDILDIELGGQCNYHCIYCDSPCRSKTCEISFEKLERTFFEGQIKWVFICGLGEPTVTENKKILMYILQLCEQYKGKCSIFTNLSNLDRDLIEYIRKGVLYLLFKYDSYDIIKNIRLYGVSDVNKQLYNIERLKHLVRIENGCTNLAASIVPTKINKNDIIDIVKDCISNNIYPLIAELENSGDAQDYYSQLALSNQELLNIKYKVNSLIGQNYSIPVCPAVISGIHVRHDGNITVDEYTGLSCHWFWLEEPKTKVIENFNNTSISNIIYQIEHFRKTKIPFVQNLLKESQGKVFGGCGGDVNTLMKQYLSIALRRKNDIFRL